MLEVLWLRFSWICNSSLYSIRVENFCDNERTCALISGCPVAAASVGHLARGTYVHFWYAFLSSVQTKFMRDFHWFLTKQKCVQREVQENYRLCIWSEDRHRMTIGVYEMRTVCLFVCRSVCRLVVGVSVRRLGGRSLSVCLLCLSAFVSRQPLKGFRKSHQIFVVLLSYFGRWSPNSFGEWLLKTSRCYLSFARRFSKLLTCVPRQHFCSLGSVASNNPLIDTAWNNNSEASLFHIYAEPEITPY